MVKTIEAMVQNLLARFELVEEIVSRQNSEKQHQSDSSESGDWNEVTDAKTKYAKTK